MTLVIIGILTATMTPVLTSRARRARVRATEQELAQLADAQERVAMDTGFFVRLYVLDDVIGGDGISNSDPENIVDGTRDNDVSDTLNPHSQPQLIFIDVDAPVNQAELAAGGNELYDIFITNETDFGWHGPYLNWKVDNNNNDWPDDPYGSDYIFFTERGILSPKYFDAAQGLSFTLPRDFNDAAFEKEGPQFSLTNSERAPADVFDRPTILSLGPNGLPGDGSADFDDNGPGNYGKGDDIFRHFGGIF